MMHKIIVWIGGLLVSSGLGLAATVTPPPFIVFTEINYHPSGGDPYEFVKLQNFGTTPVDLAGASFSGITYVFPSSSIIAPNESVLLVANTSVSLFTNRYPGARISGLFSKHLNNTSEKLTLFDSNRRIISRVEYSNGGFWPAAAGSGRTLQVIDPSSEVNDPANWIASTKLHGNPAANYSRPSLPVVRLNEFMSANLGAVTNGTMHPDWLELFNAGSTAVTLDGWSLTDSPAQPQRFRFPSNTILQPGAYLVLWCDADTNAPGMHTGFGLDQDSQTIALFDAQTNRVDAVTWGPQVPDLTLGRLGTDWALTVPTPGSVNLAAAILQPGALVLNEWYANSASGDVDWFEVYNRDTNGPVSLRGWILQTAEASQRYAGNGFLAPGGFAQLFADEEAGGDHVGFKLPSAGGHITLAHAEGTVIDRIDYGPQTERFSQGRLPDGSATLAFFPTTASPGSSNTIDRDGDGLPDYWEAQFGMDPLSPLDASQDSDEDGLNALGEFLAGTDPRDPASALRLAHTLNMRDRILTLTFIAEANRGYSLLSRGLDQSLSLKKVGDLEPSPAARPVSLDIVLPPTSGGLLYELASPRLLLPGESVLQDQQPPDFASEVEAGATLSLLFKLPLGAVNGGTNLLWVKDDLERRVPGTLKVDESLSRLSFRPEIPLAHLTTYTWQMGEPIRLSNGQMFTVTNKWKFTTGRSPELKENRQVYAQDVDALVNAKITLLPEPGGFTFEDVNQDDDSRDEFSPTVPVLFQEGTFAAGLTNANGSLGQRGQTVRFTSQKSYKITLKNSSEAWRNFRTINLNKHPYDLTRVRNRLSFELFQGIDHLTSLRSFFVQLTLDAENYGLFTVVENPDRDFLQAHGLDAEGHLYKASFFEFNRYPEALVLRDATHYSKVAFERHLEIRGSNDHHKLLAMLDDVNDSSIPTGRILDKYFNRDNLFTWFAVNILLENIDTESQNYFLYSPADSSAWYFLPWDYDGSWGFYSQPDQAANPFLSRWQAGLQNWWNGKLTRRVMADTNSLTSLLARVDELALYFNTNRIASVLSRFKPILDQHILQPPDLNELPVQDSATAQAEINSEINRLAGVVQKSRETLYAHFDRPMPFYMGRPEFRNNRWRFFWETSYSLRGDLLTYDFQVSKGPDFKAEDIIADIAGSTQTSAQIGDILPNGVYYWKVIARASKDPSIHWQIAFDTFVDAQENLFHGVKMFEVSK